MLSEDFSVQLEDGSAPMVAQALVRLHSDLLRGDVAELERLRAQRSDALAASRPEKVGCHLLGALNPTVINPTVIKP